MTHRKSDAWHARHCPTFIIDDAPYVFDGLYWSVRLRASSEGIERENPRGMLLIVRGLGMSGLGPKRTGETRRSLGRPRRPLRSRSQGLQRLPSSASDTFPLIWVKVPSVNPENLRQRIVRDQPFW